MKIVLSCLSSGFFKLVVVSFCWRERSHWLAGSSLLHYITDFKSRVIGLIKGLILDPPSSLLDQAFVRLASVLPASDLLPSSAVTVLRRPFPPSCSGSHGADVGAESTCVSGRSESELKTFIDWLIDKTFIGNNFQFVFNKNVKDSLVSLICCFSLLSTINWIFWVSGFWAKQNI